MTILSNSVSEIFFSSAVQFFSIAPALCLVLPSLFFLHKIELIKELNEYELREA